MERLMGNPRVVVLAIALIVVAGLAAIDSLPRIEDPRITNRYATVIAHFPGASAERVEALVAEPLEQQLRQIPEIEHISANARAGIAALSIELKDSVGPERADELWIEVRDKLAQSRDRLPPEVSMPTVDSERGHAFTWIGAVIWRGSGDGDALRLHRYAQELASRLNNLPGTDLVSLYGAPQEEIRVDIDPVKAASLGLDVSSISALVRRNDAKVSAGEIHNGAFRLPVEVAGAFEEVSHIRDIPVVTGSDAIATRLGDIADVYRGEKTPPRDLAIIDGERAVVVGVRMLPDVRGDRWTARLQQEVDAFSSELPVEIGVEPLFVQEGYNQVRLSELLDNILLGFGFIVVVLWLTLGWRSAVIVAASLPLTILFAFALMRFVDLPIHQMSVTGLIVALGIMVDNAIVMADTVMRYRREGFSAVAASARAAKHLWLPLLGSTLTTILAFMPIVLMPGPAGEFIGGISLAVIFSLVGSWLISLFIVAPIAGKWLTQRQGAGLRIPGLAWLYQSSLSLALRVPRVVVLLLLVLPVIGFQAASTLPEQFFPPSDRDMIDLEVYLPTGASINSTRRATEEISALLADHDDIVSLHWFIGRNAPSFYYNILDRRDGNQNYAQAMLTARDLHAANRLVSELQRTLDDAFPGLQIIARRLEQGPPSAAPVEMRIYGADLQRLKALGDELRRVALGTEDVVHVRSSLGEVVPKLWIDMDAIEGGVSGVERTGLSAKLRADLDGVVQGSVLEATEQLPVRVRVQGIEQAEVDSIALLPVALPGGGRPMMALADLQLRPAQALISRRDGERVNTVEVYIRDGVLPAVVLERLKSRMADAAFAIPAGFRLEVGGESENRAEAVGKLLGSAGIIAVLLVVTVMMAFNSFRFAFVIFAVAGLAAGMGMWSLALSGLPFGFTSIIGLMGLVGLAVNAAIVILTELKASPVAMSGDRKAIVEIVGECTRHISSTTITTVVGLLPLIMAGGGMWPPFAVVLAGGTVFTTLISLYFVPAVFLVLRKPLLLGLIRRKVSKQPVLHESEPSAADGVISPARAA